MSALEWCVWTQHGAVNTAKGGWPCVADRLDKVTTWKTRAGATRAAARCKDEKGLEMSVALVWDDSRKDLHLRIRAEARRIPDLGLQLWREIDKWSRPLFGEDTGAKVENIHGQVVGVVMTKSERLVKLQAAIDNARAEATREPDLWKYLQIKPENVEVKS